MKNNLLNDYTIKSTIGQGTFSIVKLGINKLTGEKVAIKILEKKKIIKKEELERVIREINILKNIKHLNLIKVNQIKEDDEHYYMIMEYCEKGELFNHIVKKRKLDENESSYYYYQLINGLEYIHSKHIVHRDLKPENLLINKSRILKIIDFGLSNFYIDNKYLVTPCGSPCYASPEMVGGHKYDGYKIDIWSTGIILFAMLCGYLPFDDVNNDVLFSKILKCKIEYPKFLGIQALNLLKRILVTNPDKRITISEIKQHPFYLKGKNIFNKIHPSINEDNGNNNNYKKLSVNNITKKTVANYNRDHFYSNCVFNGTKYGNYINNTDGNKKNIIHKNILTMNLEDIKFNHNSQLLKNNNFYLNTNENSSLNTKDHKKRYFSPMMTYIQSRKIQNNEKSIDYQPHTRNTSLNEKFLVGKKNLDLTHSNRDNSYFGHDSINMTDLTKTKDIKLGKKIKITNKYNINIIDDNFNRSHFNSNRNKNQKKFKLDLDNVSNNIKNMNCSIEVDRNKNNRKLNINLCDENVNDENIFNKKNTNNILSKNKQNNLKNFLGFKNNKIATEQILINKIQTLKNLNDDLFAEGKIKLGIHNNKIKKLKTQCNKNDNNNNLIHKNHQLEYLISELPPFKYLNSKNNIVNTSINLNNDTLSNKIISSKKINNKEIKSKNLKNRNTNISINIKRREITNINNSNIKLKTVDFDKNKFCNENKNSRFRYIENKSDSNDESKKNSVTINNNNYNLNIYGSKLYFTTLINSNNNNNNRHDKNNYVNNQNTNMIMKNNDFIKILKKTYVHNNNFLINDNLNINSNMNSNKYIRQKEMINKNINSDPYNYISNKNNTFESSNYLTNSTTINSIDNPRQTENKYNNITDNYNIENFSKQLVDRTFLNYSELHEKTENKLYLINDTGKFINSNIDKNGNIPLINIINIKKELEECLEHKKFFLKNRNKNEMYKYKPLNSTGNYYGKVLNIINDRNTDKKIQDKNNLDKDFGKVSNNRRNFVKIRKLGEEEF